MEELTDTAELLVSELVTNSVRYASAPIGVRLTLGDTLLVEISDPLPDPPRERHAAEADEGGRGLELVRRLALRWGPEPREWARWSGSSRNCRGRKRISNGSHGARQRIRGRAWQGGRARSGTKSFARFDVVMLGACAPAPG